MKTIILVLLSLITGSGYAFAQDFIPLWPKGKMPDSKGLKITDSISNERVHRVGTPGMYAFFPSEQEKNGAAVLICPGGGYERLAYMISGVQLAKWFNTLGISAFVLNYRLPTSPDLRQRELGPLLDVQRALKIIHASAGKWQLDTGRIGIQGSSAGGHLAALAATAAQDIAAIGDSLDKVAFRPDFMILISPVIDMGTYAHKGSRKNLLGEQPDSTMIRQYSPHLNVSSSTAPAFMVHASDDRSVSPENSILLYQALLRNKVPASLHIFPQGAHSIALHNNPGSAEYWTELCIAWMKETDILRTKAK